MITIESHVIPTTNAQRKSRWASWFDLSGRRYTFHFTFNNRHNAWLLSIVDVNGNLLIAGVRLIPGIYILEKYRASSPGLPPGELVLVDLEGNMATAEVTRENLSVRFALTYQIIREE